MKYNHLWIFSLVFVSNAYAQDFDPELLKPLVSYSPEKNPERWFETKNSLNEFPFHSTVPNMNYDEQDWFTIGRSFFTIPWVAAPSATTARDGLGPLFSANTCASCHGARNFGTIKDSEGNINRALTFKTVDRSKNYSVNETKLPQYADPIYGTQIAINGNSGAAFEARPKITFEYKIEELADGTKIRFKKPIAALDDLQYGKLGKDTHISLRMSPMLAGMGLIEGIKEEDILANEDPLDRDGDGISGKANIVYHPYNGKKMVGRFSHKAQAANLAMQAADAAAHDMGLTNSFFPKENCTPSQKECLAAPKGRPSPEGLLDLPDLRLRGIAFYVGHLKAPKKRNKELYKEGRAIFEDLGCSSCHKENWKTASGIAFEPFSDFLVHDMGEGLADRRNEFLAQGYEWRTQPLWGLGAKTRAKLSLLHDGRADSILEAILWHDGEALDIKNKFKQLSVEKRQQLLKFLENL